MNTVRERLTYPLAGVIMLGWSASLVAGVLTNSYTGLTVTTPVMLLLAGYVFGVQIVKGTQKDEQ